MIAEVKCSSAGPSLFVLGIEVRTWLGTENNVVAAELAARINGASPSASTAIEEIAAERRRQIEAEGWTPEHDDMHDQADLARAGLAYVIAGMSKVAAKLAGDEKADQERVWKPSAEFWPWGLKWWKPKDQRRNLVRGAALIVAEIERLDRKTARKVATGQAVRS